VRLLHRTRLRVDTAEGDEAPGIGRPRRGPQRQHRLQVLHGARPLVREGHAEGGELRLHGADETPDPRRERVTFRLDDGRQLWAHFWWFGMVHVVPLSQLEAHPQIGKLGPEPLADDFTAERLARMLAGRRGAIKKYLLDQSFVAGIGNVYIQEMLWRARLHPLRPANTLTPADVERLYTAMRETLEKGIRWNGGPGEQDVWGNPGRYHEHFFDTFGEGKPCPACGATILSIRVGSTGSLICPQCQAWPL
jgi:formamidopyrimidine-DNA glycosylase